VKPQTEKGNLYESGYTLNTNKTKKPLPHFSKLFPPSAPPTFPSNFAYLTCHLSTYINFDACTRCTYYHRQRGTYLHIISNLMSKILNLNIDKDIDKGKNMVDGDSDPI